MATSYESPTRHEVADTPFAVALHLLNTEAIGFVATAKLTSAAAATAVSLVADSAVPKGYVPFITKMLAYVNGSTAWTDSTGTIVTVQDTNASPVVFATIAKAGLTNAAKLGLYSANVTPGNAVLLNTGGTASCGLNVVADHNFAAGSDLYVTVYGYYALQANN